MKVPRRVIGTHYKVIEREGGLFLPWRGRIERDICWENPRSHGETLHGGTARETTDWRREVIRPTHTYGIPGAPRWIYTWTRGGLLRKLGRELDRQRGGKRSAGRREEIPVKP